MSVVLRPLRVFKSLTWFLVKFQAVPSGKNNTKGQKRIRFANVNISKFSLLNFEGNDKIKFF